MSTPPIVCLPCREPSEIRAGDTVSWERWFELYPASSGFALSYAVVSRAAAYQVMGAQVVATPDGNGYLTTLTPAVTATWAPAPYRWQAYISDANGNRWTVGEGVLQVLPNLQIVTGAGLDDREDDEKILDAIVALMSGKVLAGDAQRYTIHGRELQRYTYQELEKLRGLYARRVREIRVRRGERVTPRTVKVGLRG